MTNKNYKTNYVFAAACTGILVFGVVMISLGAILPEITAKFNLDEVKAGTLLFYSSFRNFSRFDVFWTVG